LCICLGLAFAFFWFSLKTILSAVNDDEKSEKIFLLWALFIHTFILARELGDERTF